MKPGVLTESYPGELIDVIRGSGTIVGFAPSDPSGMCFLWKGHLLGRLRVIDTHVRSSEGMVFASGRLVFAKSPGDEMLEDLRQHGFEVAVDEP